MASFDDVFETLPANGWLTKEEGKLLWDVAQTTNGPILEVGCHHGRSTVLLASLDRHVYCVDPFTNFDSDDPSGVLALKAWHSNIMERNIKNVSLFRRKIEDWKLCFATDRGPVGFAYLDGDHTYKGTVSQINTALSCGVSKICLHDYAHEGDGANIKKAIIDCERLKLIEVVGIMAHCEVAK